jgi:phosphoglycerate dehydrogenase-like enzyme
LETDVIESTERLRVALVDFDGQPVPDWVCECLRREQIDFIAHDCKTLQELTEHACGADVVWLLGGSRILMDGNLAAAQRCWAIVRTGSGTDNVPVDEATRRGIVVANTPAALSEAVSDHAIALIFAAARRIVELDRAVRGGNWGAAASPMTSLLGCTLGLIGFGHVAREVARKLSGFEMKILAHDPYAGDDAFVAWRVRRVDLSELLSSSDVVSLHCPLTPQTRYLIGERELRSMKRTALLVNTSRGAVVDERALCQALSSGWIAAAGLDVLEQEPPSEGHSLLRLDNVVFTPHAASLSADGMTGRWRASLETLTALARREWPACCVNPSVRTLQPLSRNSLPQSR